MTNKTKVKNYLTSNAKLRKDGILAFGIPAYKAESGRITCPGALDCIKGCYARQGFYVMENVKRAQRERLELTLSENFIGVMNAEIARRKPKIVRIHDSGDFYSIQYLRKWIHIARANRGTHFYGYTKMVPYFKGVALNLPSNLKITFSYGGKYDFMIDRERDAHSVVFNSLKELRAAKYTNCTERDHTWKPSVRKIGLVYHGFASKAFEAGATI